MRASWWILAAALGLAGCMDSAGEFGWGTKAAHWTLSFSDRTDSIAIKAAPEAPGPWSDWTVKENRHALGLSLMNSDVPQHHVTVGPDSATSLSPLGPAQVRIGDVIEVCAFTGDGDFPFHIGNSLGSGGVTFKTLRTCPSQAA